MQLWFCLYLLITAFVCLEAGESSSKPRGKFNVYAKDFGEASSESEVDSDLIDISDTGSGSGSGCGDYYPDDSEDCSIPNENEPEDGYIDCEPTQPTSCDPDSPYRTMNGTCNNLQYPLWGAANQCYRRIYPAFYTGFGSPRKSVTGAPLPQPRQLTVSIFKDHHHPTKNLSFMITMYGQPVAHDISRANNENPENPGSCCSEENANDAVCSYNIQVSKDDPFYSQFNVTCLDVFRTVACNACNTSKRQQNTAQTTPMDLSIVYGPDDATAISLRTNDGTGRLLSNYTKKGELLPSGNDPTDAFCPMLQKYECFITGDPRVNQHATLTSTQMTFMREHNRIAAVLKELNPHWDDEKLYQESRRINIAQVQSINYQEYLPNILGHHYMSAFDLYVLRGSRGTRYNPYLRLGVYNEFGTAAFRIHSMTATNVGALNLQFKDTYSNPGLIWQGHAGDILHGTCTVPSEKNDRWYVNDVTCHMAQRPGETHGSDLASLDIQRGRDHGIAPYVYYVYYCSAGQINITCFNDLVDHGIISKEDVKTLKKNYAKVEDIDLYVGLQMEYHINGAKVGPTTVCILGLQFNILKYADRFYFEHMGEAGSFTKAQLASLKLASWSRLLCDNTDISAVQLNAMLLPSRDNPKVWCSDIPRVDLSLWQDS